MGPQWALDTFWIKTMNLFSNAKAWLSHRRTMHQLRGLSNDTLADIGLTRFDLRRARASRFVR